MSAEQFFQYSEGKTADEAFIAAVEEAEYDHGHSGYTGTIAEKDRFVMIPTPKCETAKEAMNLAGELMNKSDDRIDDMWGPAGCIECGKGKPSGTWTYLFFGWASA